MWSSTRLIAVLAASVGSLVDAHLVLTYPGSRGYNLQPNESFPYGMQWSYPCGGLGTTTNRTLWPVTGGGAVAFEPGWFPGHSKALIYVNMGFGTDGPDDGPRNMSNPMLPVFQVIGPTNDHYEGSICLTQIPLPKNADIAGVKVGDNATIQIIETAQHGASLYSCVDITFAEPEDVEPVNDSNCRNSTHFGFNNVFTSTDTSPSGAPVVSSRGLNVLVALGVTMLGLWAL